jgi:hypothetical protein
MKKEKMVFCNFIIQLSQAGVENDFRKALREFVLSKSDKLILDMTRESRRISGCRC